MDQQVKTSSKVPIFNGEDYAFCSIRMRSHIMSIGLDVWMSLETRYIYPKSPPTDLKGIKQFGYNEKVVNAILAGWNITIFSKVMHCNTTNNNWDKFQVIYEGDTKIKRDKLQTFKAQFEKSKNEGRREHIRILWENKWNC